MIVFVFPKTLVNPMQLIPELQDLIRQFGYPRLPKDLADEICSIKREPIDMDDFDSEIDSALIYVRPRGWRREGDPLKRRFDWMIPPKALTMSDLDDF